MELHRAKARTPSGAIDGSYKIHAKRGYEGEASSLGSRRPRRVAAKGERGV